MKYYLGDVLLPLNADEGKIKTAIRERLGIGLRGFHYEVLFKKLRFNTSTQKSEIEYAFAIETSAYIKNTSISFLPEIIEPRQNPISCPKGIVLVGDGIRALFAASICVRRGLRVTLLIKGDFIEENRRQSGGYIYFPSFRGYEDDYAYFKTFLGEKCGICGDFVSLPPKDYNAFLDAIVIDYKSRGGEILYRSKLTKASNVLGRFRNITYETDGVAHKRKVDLVLMFDQGHNGSFYASIKAKKTKSQYRIRTYIESKKRDLDYVIYEDSLKAPRLFQNNLILTKTGKKVHLSFPYAEAILRNSGDANTPYAGLEFTIDRRKKNAIMVLEAPIEGGGDALRSTLSCCKRLNLPGCLPCQKVDDFLLRRETFRLGSVKTSYAPGVYLDNFHSLLPAEVSDAFQSALLKTKKEYPYLSSDSILVGVEGERYPGKVTIPPKFSSFIKAYWDSDNLDYDLVSLFDFVRLSLKELFGEAQ